MNKLFKIIGALFVCVFTITLASCGKTQTPTQTPITPPVTEKPVTPTPTPTPTPTVPTEPTESDELINYSVIVKDIAGKPLNDFYITFYLDDNVVSEGYTNNEGKYDNFSEGQFKL